MHSAGISLFVIFFFAGTFSKTFVRNNGLQFAISGFVVTLLKCSFCYPIKASEDEENFIEKSKPAVVLAIMLTVIM